MKYTNYLVGGLLLVVASAIKISEDPRPFESEFSQIDLSRFDQNVTGLYGNSSVAEIDGDDALKILNNKDHEHDYFVAAYHPQCPHCTTMVDDFKHLAQEVKDKNITNLEVVAINMSKTDFEKAGINSVP